MTMLALPAETVRFYNDGPEVPSTPLLLEAERAYRAGFLCVAAVAASWRRPADDLRDSLWRSRESQRRRAEVLVPSSELFDNPEMDSEQIVYRAGHEVDASSARGKVQACEIALQCWEALANDGVPDEAVGPLVLKPWFERVRTWAHTDIDPERISLPPRPEDGVTDELREQLEQLCQQDDERAVDEPENALPVQSLRQLMLG